MLARCCVLALLLTGCRRSDETVRLSSVMSAFDSQGWKASEQLRPIDPTRFSAQKCVGGLVDNIDTVVCELGSAEAAQRAKKGGEAWVASAVTGVALVNGNTMLALADRTRTDPLGKSIHAVTKTYTALGPPALAATPRK
ncbi:MAG: hypothetical protein ABI321_18525 [Polyangia bacterium]